ncbi:MAG TPA: molecular chaperone HscC [Pseudoduganella sp.]
MIIGIDLGTTNSLVAIWRDGKPHIIPNALGDNLTPSCVGLDDDGTILVGKAARERLQTHPHLTASVFKRYMGSDKRIRLGDKEFRPEELSSMVLRALKEDAEALLGHKVEEAIITVPAYFSDAQRKATRAAGQLAGLKVERLLNEPTAAALAYGIQDKEQESKFLVFDLGGGTFDVSILEMFEGVMEVRASTGDNFLGGEDFVEVMVNAFMARSGITKVLLGAALDASASRRLRNEAERVKRALSSQDRANMELRHEGKVFTLEFDEVLLQSICEPLLTRLRTPVERALRDASIRASELETVVLAGGATRMPIVRKMVARMFGRFPATQLDPDEVVALGAAVQAGLKMRDGALDEVVMTDVAPYSMGVAVSQQIAQGRHSNGHYLPIIERNTPVPASRVETVSTIFDYQQVVDVHVYQGEARMVSDNIFLGNLKVPVERKRAGDVSLDIRFTYDVSGVLEAEVTVHGTQERHRAVISDNAGVMTPREIEDRFRELATLKIHPREQSENRLLIAQADRLYEQSLGELRHFIAHQITAFQNALETQDPKQVNQARTAFKDLLGRISLDHPLP